MCLYEILVNMAPSQKSYWSPDWHALFDSRFTTNSWPSFILMYRKRVSYRLLQKKEECVQKEVKFSCLGSVKTQ